MLYNEAIERRDMWKEARCFWKLEKFYTGDRFGLLIDLRSMAYQMMHDSGTRLVNTTDRVQLEIERKTTGWGVVNCHIFLIADSQFNIMGRQLKSVLH